MVIYTWSVTQLATSGEISRQELCVYTSWSYWPHGQQHSATSEVSTTDMQVCCSALSWPSRDVIKACTRHSAEVTVRYFLIMPMFLRWKWPALNIELIWASIFMCSSNMILRLRSCFTEWMMLSPIVTEGGAVMVWLSFLVMNWPHNRALWHTELQ